MRIQHNIAALNSHRNLTNNNSAVSKNLEKLSSGYRINRAGDDAAGLAISEKMRAQITGLQTAQKNAEDGVSLVQTAEGALTEVHSMLNRMVELATQSANGTYEDKNRDEMQKEIEELKSEINRISKTSNFNGKKLFTDGTGTGGGNDGVKVTAPNKPAPDAVDPSNGTAANYTFDFTGLKFDKAGTVVVTLAGEDYELDVTETTTPAQFAQALAAAYTGGTAITDNNTGAFSATATDNTLTLTAAKSDATAFNDTSVEDALKAAIKIVPKTEPAGQADGDEAPVEVTLHVGESGEGENQITVQIDAMNTESLGIDTLSIEKQGDAKDAISTINDAIDIVSGIRSTLGAMQNRLEHTINNLGVQTENITAAEARIRDVDMAKEMMAYTKNNILVQASQAMLAQANQVPQGVLQLLQ